MGTGGGDKQAGEQVASEAEMTKVSEVTEGVRKRSGGLAGERSPGFGDESSWRDGMMEAWEERSW
jgi:hypothetical protein